MWNKNYLSLIPNLSGYCWFLKLRRNLNSNMRPNQDVIKFLKDQETKKIYPQTHSDSSLDEE